MKCNINEHSFGVNTDRELGCAKCLRAFVPKRIVPYNPYYVDVKELREGLKKKYGPYWIIEWNKLLALKSVVKAIQETGYVKNSIRIRLYEQKVYTWDDFSSPMDEFIKKYVDR